MKNILRLFTVLVFLLGMSVSNSTKACHLAAADIYVTYVGTGADGCSVPDYQYEVTLIIYYACQTCFNNGDFEESVRIESTEANVDTNLRMPPNVAPDTVHQLCGQFSDSNSCINPDPNAFQPDPYRAKYYPGYQKRIYTNTIRLAAATDWRFSWSSGVRNLSVNLQGQDNMYVEAGLNNVTKYNNSTPRFTSNPLPYICVNQPTTYLNNPYDINMDSISVIHHGGYSAFNNTIPYVAGYDVVDPMGSLITNPFRLNTFSGSATFTPQLQGMYVMGFKATDYEYGTGIQLSYVYRDVQVAVLPCNAPPPNIDTLSKGITSVSNATIINSNALGEAIFVCPGSDMGISLNTVSPNIGANVYMYANTDIFAGSTFGTVGQGTRNVTGTFNWTPTQANIGTHNLVITSKDSTCLISQPIVLTSYRVIIVNVVPGLDAGPDVKVCQYNPSPAPLFVYGAEDLRVKWTLDGGPAVGISNDTVHNPTVTTGEEAAYVVSTPDLIGACKSSDTLMTVRDKDGIFITPQNPVDTNAALVMCRPGYLQMEAFPYGRGRKDNINCGPVPEKECSFEESNTLYGSVLFPEKAYDSLSNMAFDLDNKVRTTKMQYLIHRNEMKKADIWAATLRSMTLSVKGGDNPGYEYGNFKILIKCTEKNELDSRAGYEDPLTMTEVFTAPVYLFADGDHKFDFTTQYNWDTSKNLIVQMYYSNNIYVDTCGGFDLPAVFRYVPTAYTSSLFLKPGPSPFNPQVPDSNVLDLTGVTTHADIKGLKTRPMTTFSYCEVPGLPFEVTWYSGEQLADTTSYSTLAYVPRSASFVAQTIGRSGCITRDTLNVYVPEHDIKITPGDTTVCLGDKAPISVTGGYYYYWHEYVNGQYVSPPHGVVSPASGYTFVGPERTTEYRIVVSDSVFCYDTISARVNVLPLPDVRILNQDDTTIRYGQPIQLLASGARFYNWSPVSSLNNPNISYPIGRPMEDTKYIVGGIGANGCRAFDTLHVIVDKRDNLFVPSAFSPNNDGKNDVFRVTNLSFQRIMEFRVFNRQGMEVFSTNDGRAGWDGTYGGVPQDIGTYSYLIRVAYPDGFVETYKGETTLIR